MLQKKENDAITNAQAAETPESGASGEAAARPDSGEEIAAAPAAKKAKRPKNPKNKKMIKKAVVIVAAAIVVVVAASLLLGGKDDAAMGVPVQAGTVEQMDLAQEVPVRGVIEGSDSADIRSALNYKITEIYVKEGDYVTEGQVLATLDGGDLSDQYRKAQLALSQSKSDFETAKVLYEEGAISKSEYDKAKNAYETDSLTVSSYDGLSDTKIKSPITGTVTRVNVTVGGTANDTANSLPMFVVENLDQLQMKVQISEFDISKIKVGQTAAITAEVLGDKEVKGTVSRIAPSGEQKEGSKEMVIPVTIDVEKGDANLIAGVTAKATILIEKRENVLTVPIDATMENPETGEWSVFVIQEGGILKQVPVTLGLEGEFSVEVISENLKPGDQVVLSPTFSLTDGMQVTVSGGGF